MKRYDFEMLQTSIYDRILYLFKQLPRHMSLLAIRNIWTKEEMNKEIEPDAKKNSLLL